MEIFHQDGNNGNLKKKIPKIKILAENPFCYFRMSKRQSDRQTNERSGTRANQKSANERSPQWDLYDNLILEGDEIENTKNEISREEFLAEIDNLKEENSKIKERLSSLMVTAQDRIINQGPTDRWPGPAQSQTLLQSVSVSNIFILDRSGRSD